MRNQSQLRNDKYIMMSLKLFIIYLQSECIEKHYLELCSKYDREHDFDVKEHDFDVIPGFSRSLSQAQMDMSRELK